MMTVYGCNLGKSWYCPITEEICDPVQNCPVARFRAGMKKEAEVKLRQKNGLIPLTGKNKNVI